MDDVRAVLGGVGSERAALVGHGHAGQLCLLVAASYPDRVQALVTVNSFARLARAPGYRAGMPEGAQPAQIEAIRVTWEPPTRCICGSWPRRGGGCVRQGVVGAGRTCRRQPATRGPQAAARLPAGRP
jgi:pimeloyl-ACP methyl ester carboxylesterase